MLPFAIKKNGKERIHMHIRQEETRATRSLPPPPLPPHPPFSASLLPDPGLLPVIPLHINTALPSPHLVRCTNSFQLLLVSEISIIIIIILSNK